MSEKSNKIVEAVTKLIMLTQDGTLEWELTHRESTGDIKVESAFCGNYRSKILQIYKYSYEVRNDFIFQPTGSIFSYGQQELEVKPPYWTTSIKLEIINERGTMLWEFPTSGSVVDLFAAVQYQVAGVEDFLDSFLDEE